MKKKALQKNNTNNSTQVLIFNSNSYNDNRGTVLSSDNRTVLLWHFELVFSFQVTNMHKK